MGTDACKNPNPEAQGKEGIPFRLYLFIVTHISRAKKWDITSGI
jgi:hypothetical protein